MAQRTEHTCDRCGKPAETGTRVSGLSWDDSYSYDDYTRVHRGEADLCEVCFEDVRWLFELRWKKPWETPAVQPVESSAAVDYEAHFVIDAGKFMEDVDRVVHDCLARPVAEELAATSPDQQLARDPERQRVGTVMSVDETGVYVRLGLREKARCPGCDHETDNLDAPWCTGCGRAMERRHAD
jgi:hypothetical protein